jgi:1-acyl-sn-glycerol-3-phosphate acyltransferase
MKPLYKFARHVVHFLMKVVWNLEITHPENFSQLHNCLIAANHISFFDPPFLGAVIPTEIYFLTKAELFKNPIMKFILPKLNSFPIRRGTIDRSAIMQAEKILSEGKSLMIFPEGTRKNAKVKAGIGKIAFQMQKNIFPIYIKNSNELLACFLRKKKLQIVVGNIIEIKNFHGEDEKKTYQEIAEFTIQKIYELENECKNR